MQRRKFLLGVGGAGIGGSSLIGSGAFSRTESERSLTIQTAEDPEAYLGLEECDSIHGDNYVEVGSDDGHLEVEIGENPNDGEGVNSNSLTWFDNAFEICNQGKEKACVWIDAEVATENGVPFVDFFVFDGDDERPILGVDNAIGINQGECLPSCVGIRTYTQTLNAGDELVEDDEIVVRADVGVDCPQPDEPIEPPEVRQAISFVAFCGEGVENDDNFSFTVTDTDNGDPTEVDWSYTGSGTISTVVVFGASRLYNNFVNGANSGTVTLDGDEEIMWRKQTEQRPNTPCPNGECGPKFDWNGAFDATGHQDECSE